MDTSERERDPGPPTVRSRITRSLFGDLVVWQVAFGLLVGIVFPFFAVLIGVRSRIALSAPFFLACLIAGGLVAFVNFWFARALVRRPLELLADRLQAVGGQVRRATAHGDPAHEVTIPRIEVQSQDSIGRVGAAFNELLDAQAHERRFRALLSHASDVVSIFEEDGSPRFHTRRCAPSWATNRTSSRARHWTGWCTRRTSRRSGRDCSICSTTPTVTR